MRPGLGADGSFGDELLVGDEQQDGADQAAEVEGAVIIPDTTAARAAFPLDPRNYDDSVRWALSERAEQH